MGSNPLASTTTGPFDLLASAPGWSSGVVADVRHAERSDVVDWQLPQWKWAKTVLENGQLPIWNWSRGGGVPGLFDLSTSIVTPSFLLYAAVADEGLGFYLAIVVRLLLAGTGMFLLLRQELPRFAALFGGITFMLSGFMAAWLYWPHTATLLWLPWLLLAQQRYLQSPSMMGWLAISATTWLLVLGGFPSVAAYCFYACGLAQLVFGFSRPASLLAQLRQGVLVGGALLLGLLLAAPWIAGLAEVLAHVDVSDRPFGSGYSMLETLASFSPGHAFAAPQVEAARYVGVLALMLALAGGAVGLSGLVQRLGGGGTDDARDALPLLGLLLLVVSLLFIAGWIPPGWVSALPGLNNSSWARMAGISGFALALLAAVGCAALAAQIRRYARSVAGVVMVALLVIQAADQLLYFRLFNGPVEKSLIYSGAASIDSLENNVGELRGVVADDAFLTSGTVNYLGFSEWLAHGFKSPAEKQLLAGLQVKGDSLFVTPTAASFRLSDLNLISPIFTALGIRYLVGGGGASLSAEKFGLQGHQPAPPLPANRWSQRFTLADSQQLQGIELKLATYHAAQAPAPVLLTLWESGAESPLAHSVRTAHSIKDNDWVSFMFPTALQLGAGDYEFRVVLSDYTGTAPLTAWSAPASSHARLWVDDAPSDISIKFNLLLTPPAPWIEAGRVDDIAVLENTAVTASAYFIRALDQAAVGVTYSSGTNARVLPNQNIELSVATANNGWVVLPIRSMPGWRASLRRPDGTERSVEVENYLGVLPALRVGGAAETQTLIYRYESHSLAAGKLIAVGALLFVLILVALRNRLAWPHRETATPQA